MDIRKVQGVEDLLRSLSVDDKGGQTRQIVFPWGHYSRVVGDDIGFWFTPQRCQYNTLRRIISDAFGAVNHPTTDRLADALVLAFIAMPKSTNILGDFEKLLKSFVSVDISHHLFVPAVGIFQLQAPEKPTTYDMIESFGHGPFRYKVFDEEYLRNIEYRFERIGIKQLAQDLRKFLGCIVVDEQRYQTRIVDFTALGFKGYQPALNVSLIQYYFDDLAQALFEHFWQEHAATQFLGVASGAPLLDRASLEALPGTGWLSIFWGFDLLRANGMISMITEERHRRDTVALKVYSLRQELTAAKQRLKIEITNEFGEGPHGICESLLNFSRLVARSDELQQRDYTEESFTLLMVALESILSEKEAIGSTLARRAAAIRSMSRAVPFPDMVKTIARLYDARSKFVHQGDSIKKDSLKELRELAREIFFTAYRSQMLFLSSGSAREKWKSTWMAGLDYVAACMEAGVTIDADAAKKAGIRSYNSDPVQQ